MDTVGLTVGGKTVSANESRGNGLSEYRPSASVRHWTTPLKPAWATTRAPLGLASVVVRTRPSTTRAATRENCVSLTCARGKGCGCACGGEPLVGEFEPDLGLAKPRDQETPLVVGGHGGEQGGRIGGTGSVGMRVSRVVPIVENMMGRTVAPGNGLALSVDQAAANHVLAIELDRYVLGARPVGDLGCDVAAALGHRMSEHRRGGAGRADWRRGLKPAFAVGRERAGHPEADGKPGVEATTQRSLGPAP